MSLALRMSTSRGVWRQKTVILCDIIAFELEGSLSTPLRVTYV